MSKNYIGGFVIVDGGGIVRAEGRETLMATETEAQARASTAEKWGQRCEVREVGDVSQLRRENERLKAENDSLRTLLTERNAKYWELHEAVERFYKVIAAQNEKP